MYTYVILRYYLLHTLESEQILYRARNNIPLFPFLIAALQRGSPDTVSLPTNHAKDA